MPARQQKSRFPPALPPSDCDSPQLRLFPDHDSPIDWYERLGADENDPGNEGYVFRAVICQREYAIKVFKFFDPNSRKFFWGPLLGEDTPLETAAYYCDPFYNECRAYGKLQKTAKQRRQKSTIAIPSHGYSFLHPRDARVLRERNFDFGLQQVDPNYQKKSIGGCRLRAIIKDISFEDHGINRKNISRILNGIRVLNHRGVYNGDIRLDNFKGGQLVDFGSSFTQPHLIVKAMSQERAKDLELMDLSQLEEMIEDENIPVPRNFRVMPLPKMTLRSQMENK